MLERANLFIVPLDDQRQWYRYHHLFQQLLRDQLVRKQERNEIAALHSRASNWFAENGLIDEALRYALNAGDLSMAAQLVEQNRLALLNDDKWYVLNMWLARLPDDVIQQRNLKAGDVVKQVAAVAGGSGGGRPHMAQAGGQDASKIDEALASVVSVVRGLM